MSTTLYGEKGELWKITQGETATPGHRDLLLGQCPVAPISFFASSPRQGAEPGTGKQPLAGAGQVQPWVRKGSRVTAETGLFSATRGRPHLQGGKPLGACPLSASPDGSQEERV